MVKKKSAKSEAKMEKMHECCQDKKKACWCQAILGLLVIILALWNPSWSQVALIVLGAVVLVTAFTGCCCKPKGACCH